MSQITTHILDTSVGKPAEGVTIELMALNADDSWTTLAAGKTNQDGRIGDLLAADKTLPAGTYKMVFQTEEYFKATGQSVFYPWADVVFNITGSGEHYHIPLLLNPFGYSTYRGS